jgi:hypothetical protein
MIIKFTKRVEPLGKEGRGKFYEPQQRIVVDRPIGEIYVSKGVAVEVPALFEEVKVVSVKKKGKAA